MGLEPALHAAPSSWLFPPRVKDWLMWNDLPPDIKQICETIIVRLFRPLRRRSNLVSVRTQPWDPQLPFTCAKLFIFNFSHSFCPGQLFSCLPAPTILHLRRLAHYFLLFGHHKYGNRMLSVHKLCTEQFTYPGQNPSCTIFCKRFNPYKSSWEYFPETSGCKHCSGRGVRTEEL